MILPHLSTNLELTDNFLAKLAGWETVKRARGLLAADRVLSSDWQAPMLRGMVQEGSSSYQAALVIKSVSDAENLCPCRDSRQRGLICAHVVAVGLHFIKSKEKKITEPVAPKKNVKALRRLQPGETGEPLELFIIIPPNFVEAASRDKIMLFVEGQWGRGRSPLEAVPLDVAFDLSAQDGNLLSVLEAVNGGDTPSALRLDAKQFAQVLPLLAGHPRVTVGKSQTLEINGESLPVAVEATLETTGEIILQIKGPAPKVIVPGWIFDGRQFQPIGLPTSLSASLNATQRITRQQIPQFLNLEWPKLISQCEVTANFALEDFLLEPAQPRIKLHLAGGIAMLEAKLDCTYGDLPPTNTAWLADPKNPTRYLTRNVGAEQNAISRLLKQGFTGPDAKGLYHLNGQTQILNFFAREYPRMEKEWQVTLEERLERSTEKNLERVEPRFQITPSGEQWFDLNVAYESKGGEQLSAIDIQQLLRSGHSHARLKSGKFALLDTGAVEELQEVLVDCAPQQHEHGYRLHKAQAGFLEATLNSQPHWKVAGRTGEVKAATPVLGKLESVLRPYQKDGVAWLSFLRANGFGGILADEMGLGKTLQVLAMIQSERESMTRSSVNCQTTPNSQASLSNQAAAGHRPALRSPTLVICPSSLVFNWAAEAAKFTPELKVLAIHGPERRALLGQMMEHDLVITSYALLRRDAEHYRGLEFDTVVLDEAQHIKNRQTQNAQAVKAIRAQHRLVLTGTPMENSVLDLWSIFDFLMPDYLGSAQDFRERYEVTITRDRNVEAQVRLARRLRPFMLRRLKRDVAVDLPEKIEQVSYCELNDEQRALYQQVLAASRQEILNAVDANGIGKSRMVVLTALLRLRQICCDLRLLKLQPDNLKVEHQQERVDSGKVEMFHELLEEILDGNHRVLVFSQFTSMLALLRAELDEQKIEYCYLDGSTKDRAAVVEKFQRDPRIPIFLISLKAGGVGLNLTGADTVIHFDPWWNPAVEAQATDRAHRIGQKRVVTSYKLITRGTVEEKILNLQARKKSLLQGMLGDEELAAALSWDEIQELIAG